MDVPRALEQGAAFAIGIVNGLDCALDPVDRALGQLEDESVVPGIESVDGVERFIDALGPTASLPILDIARVAVAWSIALPRRVARVFSSAPSAAEAISSLRNKAESRSASSTIIAMRTPFGLPARWARMRASAPAPTDSGPESLSFAASPVATMCLQKP